MCQRAHLDSNVVQRGRECRTNCPVFSLAKTFDFLKNRNATSAGLVFYFDAEDATAPRLPRRAANGAGPMAQELRPPRAVESSYSFGVTTPYPRVDLQFFPVSSYFPFGQFVLQVLLRLALL